jgi:hypothetical protein
MFTAVSDTPWPFLADLVRYQCDFSATRVNNRDLSITRGHLHVMEEVCWLRVVADASRWTLSSCFGPPNACFSMIYVLGNYKLILGAVVPQSLTEDEGTYVSASVAFEGACFSVFADGAGLLGEDNDVESVAGKVGHEDRGPRRFDRCGQGDRRRCRHRRHRRHRHCRCRRLPQRGGGGRGQRGRPPSVVLVVIGSGGGGAVPDPAATERATLDHRAVPPRPLRDALSSSPSSSSRLRPPPPPSFAASRPC